MPLDGEATGTDDSPGETEGGPVSVGGLRRRVLTLALVVGLFGFAFAFSVGLTRAVEATVGLGESGTIPELVVGVAGLQVVGFGAGTAAVLRASEGSWQSVLRVDDLSHQTAQYGAFVGLVLMSLTALATVAFRVLGVEPAESAAGASTDPVFYLVLFCLSTFVAVPMEEVFFRGIIQRRLEDAFHPAVAVAGASLLFTLVHASVRVGDNGDVLVFGLFLSIGVALGVSYYLTDNLLVPVVGHVIYNAVQILVRTAEVLL